MNPYDYLRPLLFRLDPERAHDRTLALLARMPVFMPRGTGGKPVELMGLTFPNRLGLAAGLDKNGIAVSAFDRAGFGFIEVGTVTPRPQPGNPRPRLFRLPEHEAIINRMGFNNLGIDALTARLATTPKPRALLGINLGKNKDTPNEAALDDYRIGIQKAWAHADYLAINISSPNTAGLRDLQHGAALRDLLAGIKAEQQRLTDETARRVPVVVKIAPDLDDAALYATLDTIAEAGMDGIIATNTTLDKSAVASHRYGGEQGGLSGAPLTAASTAIVKKIRAHLPQMALIAAGGVMRAADMQAKLDAGADLVQIYSGLIYHGPQLVRDCLRHLDQV
ncbi:quinone-dependent dihydroorotate dehydrogenase [Cardiobacterium hominis]|uniref:quinone-dependent dihydroorotate dehydrogenase n=1 Tax=Cardiobacterium hominis TaxID=2718 RepID=UPI00288AD8A9|nr:quinone-dependent dihydroorotate dehydrogenase [Cardiobacterium hominis]